MAPSVGTPRRGRIVSACLRCSLSTELTWTGKPDGPCALAVPSPWPCLLSGCGEGPVGRVPGVRAGRGLNDCVVSGGHPGCGFAA